MLLKEAGLQDDSMSYSGKSGHRGKAPYICWLFLKLLMKQEKEGLAEPQASLDALLGPLSSTVEWIEEAQ